MSARLLSGRGAGVHRLEPNDDGIFTGAVDGAAAGDDYVFRLEGRGGTCERPDPVSRFQPDGVHGPSRVVDPSAFAWSDDGWTGHDLADHVLYELHVGTFSEVGTFDGAIPHLDELAALGVTAIELMPIGEFPGRRNWGYDGTALYAAASAYGGPEGLRRLVDAAHRLGLGVVLDVHYNHLGPEGNYLGDFGPYFTERHRTPWGPAMNFDDADSDEVRRWVVDNAVHWIVEHHLDGLRLDAVHAIVDLGATHILAELADTVHGVAARLDRRVHLIAESDLNDPRIVRPPERGGYDIDAQWSDDFHHAVHAALTGERSGYYADFGGVECVAKTLTDRFVNDGCRSGFRRRRHGAPARDVPADRFVVFVQNHDQVGNRGAGERLAALVSPEALRLAAAVLLLSPYLPMLFMGEEYGETRPFLYFVDHGDPALLDAVRAGRRAEFAAFGWTDAVPDPAAEETFLRSRLDRAAGSPALRALYRDLLRVRRGEPALRPGRADCRVAYDAEGKWVTLALATAGAPRLLAAFNFGVDTRTAVVPNLPTAKWGLRLSTEGVEYGGLDGFAREITGSPLTLVLPPLSAALYREASA